ncbi:MBL fold metallo-hydrolase [Leifsonia sp. AG29]|uniref:MBL fold metallo-hydrolase n=1 Tax=Leifsonia sp. AG29 TaxID=2598860 RepID=UPI00131CEEB6|nr:MBL fold metallo-hydrolase [Leifsonia sp. AG29]
MTEPRPGLHRVDIPLGDRISSLYLVSGSGSVLLFDTGIRGAIPESLIPALSQAGVDPRRIQSVVVSHCDVDHFGGVDDAHHAFPHARILAHEADRAAIESVDTFLEARGRGFLAEYGLDESPEAIAWMRASAGSGPVDDVVGDGAVIDLGGTEAEVLHLPGHTLGHLGVALDGGAVHIIGDAILGESVDNADGSPAFPPTYRLVAAYRQTIRRLAERPPELLLTAHYPTLQGEDVVRFLERSEAFVDRLEALVIHEVAREADGVSLPVLLDRINQQAGRWPSEGTATALAYPVVGHLEDLEARGIVERLGSRQAYRWRSVG